MTSSWEWKQYQRMLDNATDRLCEEQSKDEHNTIGINPQADYGEMNTFRNNICAN